MHTAFLKTNTQTCDRTTFGGFIHGETNFANVRADVSSFKTCFLSSKIALEL